MEPGRTQAAWRALDTLLTVGTLGSMSDGQLLDCFRTNRDAGGQEAFRILVERHGPMVLGLCRSLVEDPHEAEDAFQATFLVLVRKAESIRKRETHRALARRSGLSGRPTSSEPVRTCGRSVRFRSSAEIPGPG